MGKLTGMDSCHSARVVFYLGVRNKDVQVDLPFFILWPVEQD